MTNKRASEGLEASALLMIKVVIALGILFMMVYIGHEMFGIGFSAG